MSEIKETVGTTDILDEKAIESEQASNRSTQHDESNATPRSFVRQRYFELLKQQKAQPDKIFIDGSSLQSFDPNLVTFDESAEEHPRSWSKTKKLRVTVVVALFCFLPPFASTIFAPSIHLVMQDLGITDSTLGALQVSIFVLAFAIGPLFLAPLSEIYGRAIVLKTGNLVFIAFAIGSGFARTAAQLSVCRFLSGIGGSVSLAVLGGVLADIWDLAHRAKASGLITLGPLLGPVLGPVCGGWMSQRASWRWTCWVPAIAAGVIEIVALFYLKESYAPAILGQKLKKSKARSDNKELYTILDFQKEEQMTMNSKAGFLFTSILRPLAFLILDPALFLTGFYYAVIFGDFYLVLVTFSDVFSLGYHHSPGIVGTDFLSIGIGIMIGLGATVKANDVIFNRHGKNKNQANYKAESRLLSCLPGALLVSAGLFMYGFSAFKTHFIVPLIGNTIFAAGSTNVMISVQLYCVDAFNPPASAFASLQFFRFILGTVFPLFGAKMYARLGVDWGVGLLGFLTLGIGLPFIPLLYVFGTRLRKVGAKNMARLEGKKQ